MKGLLLAVALFVGVATHAAERFELPRSSPEAQGIASSDVLALVEALDAQIDSMNSFMLLRHGHVVAEGWWTPYGAESRHVLYSLTKSFTSTAVGMAIAEGHLSLHDRVIDFFPEESSETPSENLQQMRVHDLLRMATGHASEPEQPGTGERWTRTFLEHEVPYRPGTHFLYNTPGSNMLSAILQKATGMTAAQFLASRLFEPLGIEEPLWQQRSDGVSIGGYGLNLRTEDIARFAQLYLQKGQWQGRQLLPAKWVEAATSLQVANGSNPDSDWNQGYGYQFWRSRHGSYRGDGAFGQYAIVMPEHDVVVAITSGVRDMQQPLNLIFDKLLPALRAAPLEENEVARQALKARLAALKVHLPEGDDTSPTAERYSGRRYHFEENMLGLESVELDVAGREPVLKVQMASGRHRLRIGSGDWQKSRSGFAFGIESNRGIPPQTAVAASGAWTDEAVYSVKVCLYETPFYTTVTFAFEDDGLRLKILPNVAFGAREPVILIGKGRT